jgi:hypothetical protein
MEIRQASKIDGFAAADKTGAIIWKLRIRRLFLVKTTHGEQRDHKLKVIRVKLVSIYGPHAVWSVLRPKGTSGKATA